VNIFLPYGQRQLEVSLGNEDREIMLLEPNKPPHDPIRLALAAPIGSPRLHEIVRPGNSIVIVTSDITRPCPTHLMLPPLLEELARAGVRDEDIQIIFALGSHRAQTAEERIKLIGVEMAQRFRYLDSDPNQTVYLGTTTRGTLIEAFEPVVNADIRIALGNVEPHYFAGYSGGAKALVPGVCSLATIQSNHAMMVHSNASVGVLDDNPVREDIEEAAAIIGLDFILNVIVDGEHTVVSAAAGHPVEAHRWLCRVLDYQRKIAVEQLADIVIVSAGGYPKDINLYQAQKALDSAAAAVRPGGIIIWIAECPEGFGNPIFEDWLIGNSADDILARIQKRFVLGGHKAAAIARVLQRATVFLVSSLPPTLVRDCGMIPYSDLDLALGKALDNFDQTPIMTVLPTGSAVVPVAKTASYTILEGDRA